MDRPKPINKTILAYTFDTLRLNPTISPFVSTTEREHDYGLLYTLNNFGIKFWRVVLRTRYHLIMSKKHLWSAKVLALQASVNSTIEFRAAVEYKCLFPRKTCFSELPDLPSVGTPQTNFPFGFYLDWAYGGPSVPL